MSGDRLLRPGVYGSEFKSSEGPFGLRTGQMRYSQITHNSGWYNNEGEKIGWGDLSVEDFERIRDEIGPEETFVVLSESDSFWHFVNKPGIIGSRSETRETENKPGIGYVTQHAMYIFQEGTIYSVDRYSTPKTRRRDGLEIRGISQQDATRILMPSDRR